MTPALLESTMKEQPGERSWRPSGPRPDRGYARRFLKRQRATLAALRRVMKERANRLVRENARLLLSAMHEVEAALPEFANLTQVEDAAEGRLPRAYALAEEYWLRADDEFSEASFVAWVTQVQEREALAMAELWALRPALLAVLLARIAARSRAAGLEFAALRQADGASWKEMFEAYCVVEHRLALDPAGVYTRMDAESRDTYRKVVSRLAKGSHCSESEVVDLAVAMASSPELPAEWPSGAVERRRHVGFYLVDAGLPMLERRLDYRKPWRDRFTAFVERNATALYLGGVELLTFFIAALLLSGLPSFTPVFAGLVLLLLPATHAAVHFFNILATSLVPPRVLPKLDFSDGVPAEFKTVVAVPVLLINERQVEELVRDLEIRYLGNRDENLYFGLVSDTPDSDRAVDERDQLAELCVRRIEELNARYPRAPFFLLHRHRAFNEVEKTWMGWERKRGKILDLNRFLCGGDDNFPVQCGPTRELRGARYVITLDSDTQLPRGAAARMVGAMAHPLQRAVIDPETNMVVEGYGILQPRVSVSVASAAASRLSSMFSGQTGFDIYTRAVSDVYQDLFGEGSFTGKGIFDVDVFCRVLQDRFPANQLLSHDLLEGIYARTALVSDIEVVDDYPSHFSAYSRRQHRWMRGDWQVMHWLLPVVPNFHGKTIENPISVISRWKIIDNLRRTLIQPATLLLLLAGWFWLPGPLGYWTAVSVALLLIPVYSPLLFTPLRLRKWPSDAVIAQNFDDFMAEHFQVLLQVIFLMQQGLSSLDAMIRSIVRVRITRRRMLEWETAAQAETNRKGRAPVDLYLLLSPVVAAGIGTLLYVFAKESLLEATPILALWMAAPLVAAWLNRPLKVRRERLSAGEQSELREMALKTWRYFREFSNEANHGLIPDNVQEEGERAAERLSPTNLGLLLNARVAAVELGYLSLDAFCRETRRTLETVQRMEKHRGHLFNWYNNLTLEALEPRFVSTVDSGNLAVCLWTLRQAAVAWKSKAPAGAGGLEDIVCLLAAATPLAKALEERIQRGEGRSEWAADAARLRDQLDREEHPARWWAAQLTELLEAPAAVPARELDWIADTAGELVDEMDFHFLYDPRKKLMAIGYDAGTETVSKSYYDLLASEARLAVLVAIAKGDIAQEAWFHLGRTHTLYQGSRILLSWSGTAFEYLMPVLWVRHGGDTLLAASLAAVVDAQRKAAGWRQPWGVSEAAYGGRQDSGEFDYGACGLTGLALQPDAFCERVVSPYSTFLALPVAPVAAIKNLRHMERLGWMGDRGFYESADYSSRRLEKKGAFHLIRTWMAHHQGMSLLAAANALLENRFQELFHHEPAVAATERVLDERLPLDVVVDAEVIRYTQRSKTTLSPVSGTDFSTFQDGRD